MGIKNFYFSNDLKYLRKQKDKEVENPDLTEKLEDKYPDTKKPFPDYKKNGSFTSMRKELDYLSKTAGALTERLNQVRTEEQTRMQKVSETINNAINKFRSLIFEVSGSDQVIEVVKTPSGIEMKIFEDKDSPTPSKEKKFGFGDFINFFFNKLARNNIDKALKDLSQKGVTEISRPILATVKAYLRSKSAAAEDSKKFLVSKTYEVYDTSSLDEVEEKEFGFVYKDKPMSLEEIKDEIESEGYSEWSNSDNTGWLSTVDPLKDTNFFKKGEEKFYQLHFKKLDGSKLSKQDYALINSFVEKLK